MSLILRKDAFCRYRLRPNIYEVVEKECAVIENVQIKIKASSVLEKELKCNKKLGERVGVCNGKIDKSEK